MVKEGGQHHAPTSDTLLNLLKSMNEKSTFKRVIQEMYFRIPPFFQPLPQVLYLRYSN